jgi:hypothetical protein
MTLMLGLQNVYVGQTGHPLDIKYKLHMRNRKYNREDSDHVTHSLNKHGKIQDIREKIHYAQKLG